MHSANLETQIIMLNIRFKGNVSKHDTTAAVPRVYRNTYICNTQETHIRSYVLCVIASTLIRNVRYEQGQRLHKLGVHVVQIEKLKIVFKSSSKR